MEYIELMNKRKEICNYYKNIINSNGDKCKFCPLSYENNGKLDACNNFMLDFPEEAQEIVSNWEETVDWSTVPVDTKILVRDTIDSKWFRAYFAGYVNGKVYAFDYGATSWSASNEYHNKHFYKYAKLYKE